MSRDDLPRRVLQVHEVTTKRAGVFELEGPDDSPEKNLLIAVIARAVSDALGGIVIDGDGQRERASALAWIFSIRDDDYHTPFSFAYCCSELDIDQKPIQRRVAKAIWAQRYKDRTGQEDNQLKCA
jgi:hypothetical protein